MMMEYFAAANTGNGFYSLFDTCFSPDKLDKLYILKGGPGTGKSTLMRKIANMAELYAYRAEKILCSSDPGSLDGVILPDLGIAVVDGTSPHAVEPLYPGVVEEYVDLSVAFEKEKLHMEKLAVASLVKEKKRQYRQAYRYLEGAARMAEESRKTAETVFLTKKAEAAIDRLTDGLKKTRKGECRRLFFSSYGTCGCVSLPTLRKKAKTVYAICGKYGAEQVLLQKIYTAFLKKGYSMTVGMHPLCPDFVEQIFLEGENLLFYIEKKEVPDSFKKINAIRFVDSKKCAAVRTELRFLQKCRQILTEGALSSLQKAGMCHAKLEKLYGKYTDFTVIERIQNKILSEIFSKPV